VGTGLRKALITLAGLGVIVLLLYKLRNSIHLAGFRWALLWDVPRHARVGYLLLAVVMIYICYGVRAVRWTFFARRTGPAHFRNIYPCTLMGFACLFLLGRAAEPIRPLLISRKDKVPVGSVLGTYVLERIYDLSATAFAAGFALLMVGRGAPVSSTAGPLLAFAQHAGGMLLLGAVVAIAFLIYLRVHGAGALGAWLEAMGRRRRRMARVAGIFNSFTNGLHAIRNAGDLAISIALTIIHWGCNALIYIWVSYALGGRMAAFTFSDALLIMTFTMVGSALQLPGVGGGSQLATFLVLTAVYGVANEPAAVMAIVIWLITFAEVTLAGVPLLIREGWSLGELRRMASAERAAEARGGHIAASVMPQPSHSPAHHAPSSSAGASHHAKERP
jgi:uncharacterized protein (TIRG00374 family)